MSEIYSNLDLKKSDHLDRRLRTVTTFTDLSDPTVVGNFLYVGASAYVEDEDEFYKVNSSYVWTTTSASALNIGIITIASGHSEIDLQFVIPAIEECSSVLVKMGTASNPATSLNIQSITNFPNVDREITFYTEANKEITFNHKDYDAATSDQIVMENGFNFTLSGRSIGNESISFKKQGPVVCQWDAVQFMKSTDWAQNLLSIAVVNSLESTSGTTALSANQGRVLKGLIDEKQENFSVGNRLTLTSNNLEVTPASWTRINDPVHSIDLTTFAKFQQWLILLLGSKDNSRYYYVQANNISGNHGIWLLPAGADPSNFGSWNSIGEPQTTQGLVEYKISPETSGTLGSQLIGGRYYLSAAMPSGYGDVSTVMLSTNSDGDSTNKVSFGFIHSGTYTVELNNLQLIAPGTPTTAASTQDVLDNIGKLSLVMNKTDGVQSASSPANTGVVVASKSAPYKSAVGYGATDFAYVEISIKATFVIPELGNDDGYTFSLGTTVSSMDWSDIWIGADMGKLKIIKHK